MLIEHYAGAFPLWLAPVQARGVVVSEKQEAFAREVAETARARAGCASTSILSNDKLGAKIRRAQLEKIPYMLVVGDKEVAARHGRAAQPRRQAARRRWRSTRSRDRARRRGAELPLIMRDSTEPEE